MTIYSHFSIRVSRLSYDVRAAPPAGKTSVPKFHTSQKINCAYCLKIDEECVKFYDDNYRRLNVIRYMTMRYVGTDAVVIQPSMCIVVVTVNGRRTTTIVANDTERKQSDEALIPSKLCRSGSCYDFTPWRPSADVPRDRSKMGTKLRSSWCPCI
jgi:hypothetical protein